MSVGICEKVSLKGEERGTSFWSAPEENFWAPLRTCQVDSNVFIPISLLSRWPFCSVLQVEELLELPVCSSASIKLGFGAQMEHRWRGLGAGKRKFSEVSEQKKEKES